MEPNDIRLRHHIQLLADAGLIRAPVNTWPLMWLQVIDDVRAAREGVLEANQRRAVEYVYSVFLRQSVNNGEWALSSADQHSPIRGFGNSMRESGLAYIGVEHIGEGLAGRIRLSKVHEPTDGDEWRTDGSYLAGLWGNWVFAVGSLDRWWGPGWETALTLSNNARPPAALSIQRHGSEAFESKWLSWIGPWQLTAFVGRLDDPRVIEDAYLVGAKLSFKPADWLELGLSRTAQWGGEGRPQDFSSFKNLVLGRDNTGSDGISRDNEPGNQIGGVDWRFSFGGTVPFGIYGEIAGEDESGYTPSRLTATLGLDLVLSLPDSDLRVIAEYSDTATQRLTRSEPQYNTAYEHSIYRSGYRYYGQSIGASVDNDSRTSTLAGLWQIGSNESLSVKIKWLELNSDGAGIVFPSGNSVAIGSSKGWYADIGYKVKFNFVEMSVGYVHYDSALVVRGIDTGDDTVEVGFNFIW
ncbi:MAG TPA: capsule assembly Wzi family protein [Spongiibacteraceae bacterium]|nr:hypothetical protein [Spongiibacteraceae bacterium]HCS28418.1 capsule assembly Wzi family protein [Spongiibacteraceae bacterium]